MAIRLKTFDDYLDFVKRRKYYIAVTWMMFSIVSVIIAYNLPKTFRSTATLLVEAPIPTKIIENMPLQFADEQLQSIYQRVMTTDNVYSLIESTNLYADFKKDVSKHKVVELFKESTEIELGTSTLSGKTGLGSGIAEIAFNISFKDNDPKIAKEIASKLASMFIQYNDKARAIRAGKATDFLKDESDKLNLELADIEKKIINYKEEHNFNFPEQVKGNIEAIERAEVELRDTASQIRGIKDRITFLSSELARFQIEQPLIFNEQTPLNKEDVLAKARAEYLRASQIYMPNHPTMQQLKREISALESQDNAKPVTTDTKNQIHSRSPAYINLESQYKSSQSELESLIQKQEYLKNKIETLRISVSQGPLVEKGYNDLARERDNLIKKYNELKEKLADAKVFQTLEEGQQGKTITMLEPPIVPEHAEKASRRKVAIGGFIAGFFIGVALAFVVEFFDPVIRGYKAVAEITGIMPTVVLPYIDSPDEEAKKLDQQLKFKKMIVWGFLIATVIASVVVVSFFSFSS